MSDDEITLTPVYRFEWSDGTTRQTDDPDATEEPWPSGTAVEALAERGRADPDCEVTLLGMGS